MRKILLKWLTKRYDIVTFDIFDTLIERTVDRPSDIFFLAAKRYYTDEKAEEFRQNRILAEKVARDSAKGEVTLDDIYKQLKVTYPEDYQKLQETEIELELTSCYPKAQIVSFFKDILEQNKQVYLISDMYLPQEVIEQMLKNCGITGFSKLYLSNVYGVDKISGKLFEEVMADRHFTAKDVIHIGDSLKADVLGARKVGIVGLLIGRKNRLGRWIKKS